MTDPFDLIREWFDAFNRGDLARVMALYHPDVESDLGAGTARGVDAVRGQIDALMAHAAQRTVRMIARVENGAMHAEWRGRESADAASGEGGSAGYDDFWLEDGRIRRQRSVRHPFDFQQADDVVPAQPIRPSRQYPSQPIVGVGAVIVSDGKVVLVKRKYEPLAGQWSLPGGRLELGESLEAGLAREMLEETGLVVEVGPVVDVFDRILLDPERRVRYHYVLIDYLCRPAGGSLAYGSDVAAAEWVAPEAIAQYRLTPKATAVIEKGFEFARMHIWR